LKDQVDHDFFCWIRQVIETLDEKPSGAQGGGKVSVEEQSDFVRSIGGLDGLAVRREIMTDSN
jgi:hypothetical protein